MGYSIMARYEYQCIKCNEIKEIERKISDDKIDSITCEKCKGKMVMIISSTSFSLKGKGWFKDGYRK